MREFCSCHGPTRMAGYAPVSMGKKPAMTSIPLKLPWRPA